MKTQVGTCPHCGAPIYVPTIWHGIMAPPNEYTCSCVEQLKPVTTTGTSVTDIPDPESSSDISAFDGWGQPYLVNTIVNSDSIELIYRRDSCITYTDLSLPVENQDNPEIFKVIYSCKDGKWHQSEKIEGEYIPASEEGYEFV